MEAPSYPAPPDPNVTAAAQTQSNKETAVANANMNRIDQYTPQGSTPYQVVGTNADGTPNIGRIRSSPRRNSKFITQTSRPARTSGRLARISRSASADFWRPRSILTRRLTTSFPTLLASASIRCGIRITSAKRPNCSTRESGSGRTPMTAQ